MKCVFVLFLLSVIMCTAIFPYNYVELYATSIYSILQKIEYPWRFLSMASMFIFCIFIMTSMRIMEKYGRKLMWVYVMLVILITGWQSTELMNRIVNENPAFDTYSIINPYWATGEYLPSNTDMDELGNTDVLTSDASVIATDMTRNGIDISISVRNDSQDEGYVQLPLLCYPYYQTKDDRGNALETIPGDYRKLCFAVPPGFHGKVSTFFREPVSWRIAEVISLITLVSMLMHEIKKWKTQIKQK